MIYKRIKVQNIPIAKLEAEMRKIWKDEYCKNPIKTFDNVTVHFYENMFDHCFYESENRKEKDKSILSLNRLEKILWIKQTLLDKTAILKKSWDTANKVHFENRRVAIVKENYVVIIMFTAFMKAKFITAYEKNDIENILLGPDFEKPQKYFGSV